LLPASKQQIPRATRPRFGMTILWRFPNCTTTAFLSLLTLAAHSWAQAVPKPLYVESFRKGPTRLAELLLVANLTAENADYKATVKDSRGNARYQLSLEPAREEGGAERVVSWRVLLIDPHRRYMGNFLVATRPPEPLTDRPQDRAWWLDPSPYAIVPLRARRVFRVEDFYCVIQVKHFHVLPENHLPDAMTVEIRFTETDPRQN
jgi:hypothetical protein